MSLIVKLTSELSLLATVIVKFLNDTCELKIVLVTLRFTNGNVFSMFEAGESDAKTSTVIFSPANCAANSPHVELKPSFSIFEHVMFNVLPTGIINPFSNDGSVPTTL